MGKGTQRLTVLFAMVLKLARLSLRPHTKPIPSLFSSQRRAYKSAITIDDVEYPSDQLTNVTPQLLQKVMRKLHHTPHHPINIIAQRISYFWQHHYPRQHSNDPQFVVLDNISPVVTTQQNFDNLGFPKDHPGRSVHDSYYLNETHLLRTHTSAHQVDCLRHGHPNFLLLADCYRRDEIDRSHYPVFHQIEGFRTFDIQTLPNSASLPSLPICTMGKNPIQAEHSLNLMHAVAHDLMTGLEAMCRFLFGSSVQLRWDDDRFPFTSPSWELHVLYNEEWVEVLGCGIVKQHIFTHARGNALLGTKDSTHVAGWAFGLGLERLAMILFEIPDIRLFWTKDNRFIDQFRQVNATDPSSLIQFKPFSTYPPCFKDLAFWLPSTGKFVDNALFDIVRSIAGDLVEQVALIDHFVHPKTQRVSKCFRIMYRSMDRTVTNDEMNVLQTKVRGAVVHELGVELR